MAKQRSRVIPYTIRITTTSGWYYTPTEWRIRSGPNGPGFGQPTSDNIDRWVRTFEESMRSGPNRHLGLDQVVHAEIIKQSTGQTVATWDRHSARLNQPLFEVIN